MDGLDDGLGERFNARNNLKCLLGIFPPRGKVLGKSIDQDVLRFMIINFPRMLKDESVMEILNDAFCK